MAEDLVIRISGDISRFDDSLAEAAKATEGLEGKLSSVAKISAVAFAALTGEVILSAKAFGEAQQIGNQLTQSMQNQGIYSARLLSDYEKISQVLQEKTGIDDDEIKKTIATTQGLIGQQEVTQGLTKAILDLSAGKQIDLQTSAELISKGINGQVGALQRLGIVVEEGLSRSERQARILELVNTRYGDQAESANKGVASIRGLSTAFGNLQEEIGARFAPAIEAAIKFMTGFVNEIKENKVLLDFGTAALAAGLAIAGLGIVVGTAGTAFLALRAALLAANITLSATRVAVSALVGATGIGLLVLLVTEIYLNWSSIWPKTQAVFSAFASNVGNIAAGLGKIIYGALVGHDLGQIKAGYDQLLQALKESFNAQAQVADQKSLADVRREEETANKKKAVADREQALRDAKEQRELDLLHAKNELVVLETEKASTRVLEIKKQEVELLGKLEDDKNAKVREQLQAQLELTQEALVEAQAQETEARQVYNDQILADNEQYQQLSASNQQLFQQQQNQALVSSIETRQTAQQLYVKNSIKTQIESNNQKLQDELKFGKAYALINQLMHSEIYQGSKQAFGELAQLQQSSNSTLKAIGKAAAVANIVIKTAESAMNIYSGFSTIPFIGQALGIAGAAAAIAFGAEQIGRVTGAAEGGLITGGIKGIDSVPAMLQHGELVAPTSNFDEVIGSVRAEREAQKIRDAGGGGGDGAGGVIEIVMKGDADELFEARIVARQKLNISLLEST
jgi:hypothetical protein